MDKINFISSAANIVVILNQQNKNRGKCMSQTRKQIENEAQVTVVGLEWNNYKKSSSSFTHYGENPQLGQLLFAPAGSMQKQKSAPKKNSNENVNNACKCIIF